jgi:inner membrane protein
MLGKKLGKKALLLGAFAQSLPDVDFMTALWSDVHSSLLAHRGFTHSIVFDVLAAVVLALAAGFMKFSYRVSFLQWLVFFAIQISVHLLLDLFNTYGLGLLEPFDHRRFSLNALFVADPFFSVWPAVGFLVLLIMKQGNLRRGWWWKFGLGGALVYLIYCSYNKIKVETDLRDTIVAKGMTYQSFFTTPTPLNNWLWYLAVKQDSGFYIGYRSVFDNRLETTLHYFPRNDSLLHPVRHLEEVQHLVRFSQGYYTVEKYHDTLVFNDLRFGQIVGWYDPAEKFVFHYYLQQSPDANHLVVQRGRFAKWNRESVNRLLRKIMVK